MKGWGWPLVVILTVAIWTWIVISVWAFLKGVCL